MEGSRLPFHILRHQEPTNPLPCCNPEKYNTVFSKIIRKMAVTAFFFFFFSQENISWLHQCEFPLTCICCNSSRKKRNIRRNFHWFCSKTYLLGTHWNCFAGEGRGGGWVGGEGIPVNTYNITRYILLNKCPQYMDAPPPPPPPPPKPHDPAATVPYIRRSWCR